MATVIAVDGYVTDEWYPGFRPAFDHAPFVVEPFRTFTRADEERFWFLDFHWPRGLTPLGLIANEDGYSWGTQWAAESMPVPFGRGVTQRIAGTHTYAAAIPIHSEREVAARAARLRRSLPGYLATFEQRWNAYVAELDAEWDHLRGVDLGGLPLPELGRYLCQARAYHKRAFEIHFEVMYALLANYLSFRDLCRDLGIDSGEIPTFLQGYDTKIMETDREIARLAREARAAGLAPVFAATQPQRLVAALTAAGGAATAWLARFGEFLDGYGQRIEGTSDVALPSWIEDPAPPLGSIGALLRADTEHDFDAARKAAVEEREAAIDAARASLTLAEQRTFDAGLASALSANFPRWQDDHNYHIDMRVSLPMRWAALAIADRVGADRPDDTLFLFWPEIQAVAAGGARSYRGYRTLVEDRRQYFDHWYARRATMPKVLGTVPETFDDPILSEIFGFDDRFLGAVGAGPEVTTLSGIPAARGTARGTARVLNNPDELHRVRHGDILVCESTTPNWTPVFARIAGCVCDSGGTLSHAAIVGREYGVPTVTACAVATVRIRDGDEVAVDGTAGTVTIRRVP
jgi:phosphohistidine swiveling domain-containing protein